MSQENFMIAYKEEIEEYMRVEMKHRRGEFPPKLADAMEYSLFAGGKRLRPILCMCAAEAVGAKRQDVLPAAFAMECVHTYSLIHDDLPGMDNDDFRRGKPTNHKVFGEAIAILAGDGLLTLAFEILADMQIEAEKIVAITKMLAHNAGGYGMVGGQVVDILSENEQPDKTTMHYIHAHKTGDLIIASLAIGAIAAGAQRKEIEALKSYGENLGLAFQITDDILDLVGDEKKLGKPVGSDERNNKATYPALYGLSQSRILAKEAVEAAKQALEMLSHETKNLHELADYLLTREN